MVLNDVASITTIDQKIAELFNNNFGLGGEWSWGNALLCLIAVILSIFLCGMIGLERERRGRSAGLRTHLLVGVGSCVVMILSIYGFPAWASDRDVARLAAQVVTGIGFLGAGAIMHFNGGIKGLTTASSIWLAMAIGLACGSMNFLIAIGVTLVVLVILVYFKKMEKNVIKTKPAFIVTASPDSPVLKTILQVSKNLGYSVVDLTSTINNDINQGIEVTFKLASENGGEVKYEEFAAALTLTGAFKSVQILNQH